MFRMVHTGSYAVMHMPEFTDMTQVTGDRVSVVFSGCRLTEQDLERTSQNSGFVRLWSHVSAESPCLGSTRASRGP